MYIGSIHIGGAAETIGSIHGAGIVAVAVGAAHVLFEALPAAAAQNTVDALRRPLGIIGLLD